MPPGAAACCWRSGPAGAHLCVVGEDPPLLSATEVNRALLKALQAARQVDG